MDFEAEIKYNRLTWDDGLDGVNPEPRIVAFSTGIPIRVRVTDNNGIVEDASNVVFSIVNHKGWDNRELAVTNLTYDKDGWYEGTLSTNTIPIRDLIKHNGDIADDINGLSIYIGVSVDGLHLARISAVLESPVVGASQDPPDAVPAPGNAILYSQPQSLSNSQRWVALGNVGFREEDGKIYMKSSDGSEVLVYPQDSSSNTVVFGNGDPDGSVGKVGDCYINRTNSWLYEKTGGSTWTRVGILAINISNAYVMFVCPDGQTRRATLSNIP